MSIREYIDDDFTRLSAIYANSKLDELINEDSEFTLVPLEEDDKRLSILMASDIYVYDDQGIIGYGAHDGSEITALFVHPEHRGRGVGRTLLEYLLSKIPEQAYLYVARSNELAIGIYQEFGFEIVEEFQVIYNRVPAIAAKLIRS